MTPHRMSEGPLNVPPPAWRCWPVWNPCMAPVDDRYASFTVFAAMYKSQIGHSCILVSWAASRRLR